MDGSLAIVMLCFAAALTFACAIAALAQPPRGVGYSAVARGYTQSCYKLGTLAAPYTCQRLDEAADTTTAPPGEFAATFERRYGRCTLISTGACAATPFKRWQGPGNEVKSIVADALSWKFGGGVPTEQEVTDAQATGDTIWREFLVATGEGFSPERPHHYNDPAAPCGLRPAVTDPFWGIPYYHFNDAPCGGVTPVPTPTPTPSLPPPQPTPSPAPTATPCPTAAPAPSLVPLEEPVACEIVRKLAAKAPGSFLTWGWLRDSNAEACAAWMDANKGRLCEP